MMEELWEYQAPTLGSPAHVWAYQDEDVVGWAAKFTERRGGPTHAAAIVETVMNRYRAMRHQ